MPITMTKPALKQLIGSHDLIGAEIGVYKGDHAAWFLKDLDIKLVYLIDPFTGYDGFNPDEFGLDDLEKCKKIAHNKLGEYKQKIKWLEMRSTKAAEFIKDDSLDFVYIDANHTYKAVTGDILAVYPKLKKGGLLSGHDYDYDDVKNAVDKFVNKNNLNLLIGAMAPGQFKGKGIKFDWWAWKDV